MSARQAVGDGQSERTDADRTPVRLHRVDTGEIALRVMRPRRPRRGPAKLARTLLGSMTRAPSWHPVPAFLVEHPNEGPFLVDVGYDPSVASDPARTLGLLFGRVLMRHRCAARTVRDQVAACGVDPADVRLVVMTHLHLDHVSASGQWPAAEFVVDRAELAAAFAQRAPGPYVRSHLSTIRRWREIDYGSSAAAPFASFARTIDLFGDGSVRLISSPGHSPGHQSVLLRLAGRYALICGDAAMSALELRERVVDGLIIDQRGYLRSGDEARAFVRAHPETLAIASHHRDRPAP